MNIMQFAIHPNEYSCVSMCSSAKGKWDNLKLIYEGTSEVKETKANILVSEYELFRMKPEETISEMFARFTTIMNGLKALGKDYTRSELVRKILRSLPPAWHTKATVIEDSKNMATLSLEELIGSFMAYELNMKRNEPEIMKGKGISLKAASVRQESNIDEDSDVDGEDDELAMLTKKMQNFLHKRKSFQSNSKNPVRRSFPQKGESSKENEVICYECKKLGHMRGVYRLSGWQVGQSDLSGRRGAPEGHVLVAVLVAVAIRFVSRRPTPSRSGGRRLKALAGSPFPFFGSFSFPSSSPRGKAFPSPAVGSWWRWRLVWSSGLASRSEKEAVMAS
ncbi:hypothetical protein Taro_006951 [Colocasia esculenta]|uniref:UBN2 domain-containing protein n=1 Tax=Colocasia esculenta TaxID=4460 RepID=A0A843TXK2_COLES|nr:hypothetical protein [Colocasia esculenta]